MATSVVNNLSRLVFRRGLLQQPWVARYPLCSAAPQSSASDASSSPPTPPPAAEAEAAAAAAGPPAEELQKQIEELKLQVQDLDDKYKRSLADRENVRTRLEKQVKDGKLFGIQSFCKDLLDVADILGKATESVPPEEISESNPHLKSLYEGLKMTEAQLITVFRRHGVVPINPVGEKFDPHQHEALFQQEVEGVQSGHVAVVTKIGYKLHERTIRPALVGVAK
ncbi:grpE protein homolog, mitochondrial-like [Amphibalanus amphitrite]|uniref:grpE protein homolog, mitochondrial-like n=1 Tax=Amphibalanus amphitrite TaxID=1232801 RepID=UPI001C927EC7|nr:grpE protein homolog, mitochondrial-like [Amphibalanus amphitrite]XP_043202408.1 grpE protein homolog, mitochondrial-like [Amphibalanus amphitrite]